MCGCVTASPHGDWSVTISRKAFEKQVAEFGRRKGDRKLSELRRPLQLEVHRRNQAGRPVDFELSGSGESPPVLISAESVRRIVSAASVGDSWRARPRSSCFEIETSKNSMKIRGRGFGHGVGVCQYGAEEMARRGASSLQILARYYPGADVEQAWSAGTTNRLYSRFGVPTAISSGYSPCRIGRYLGLRGKPTEGLFRPWSPYGISSWRRYTMQKS